jgi:DNA-binding transcriptional MerR regulator
VSERRWSIGELARASGVTVRTLHHYDRIGLVSPGERTPAGHRRYVEADVRRLYRVRTLCGMGLSLDEVAVVLRNAGDDLDSLRGLLTAQRRGGRRVPGERAGRKRVRRVDLPGGGAGGGRRAPAGPGDPLAEALGISRQAAWKRFANRPPLRDDSAVLGHRSH